MPELPEITILAGQLGNTLRGRVVQELEVRQPKCLNVPPAALREALIGKTLAQALPRGKWIDCALEPGWQLLLHLGMGGDLLFYGPGAAPPEKYQFRLQFENTSGFTIAFWWFGYVHLVAAERPEEHEPTAQLGPSMLDPLLTAREFRKLLDGRRGAIKTFLLDQRRVAGIGNVYAQDPLFKAGIHPLRPISTLAEEEIVRLHQALREDLAASIVRGGLSMERDFFGRPGGLRGEDFLVGYKAGQPCPTCGTTIEKIKTGATSSYICPCCQVL